MFKYFWHRTLFGHTMKGSAWDTQSGVMIIHCSCRKRYKVRF
jgi:hypothetical protein